MANLSDVRGDKHYPLPAAAVEPDALGHQRTPPGRWPGGVVGEECTSFNTSWRAAANGRGGDLLAGAALVRLEAEGGYAAHVVGDAADKHLAFQVGGELIGRSLLLLTVEGDGL